MEPIDIESSGSSEQNADLLNDQKVELVKYLGIEKEYPEYTINGEKWIQHVVAEHMLRVGPKQFERYCADPVFDPKIEKRRIQTPHYSYIFVKESDVNRISSVKGRALRIPLKDIPSTDPNKKIFSKTDVESMAKTVVNEQALAIFKNYDLRIHDLETKNEHLNTEVNRLTIEKSEIIETKSKEISQLIEEKSQIIESKSKEISQIAAEKHEILEKKTAELNQVVLEKSNALNKKRTRELWIMAMGAILVIGGGVASIFIYTTNKDNDRLYDEKKHAVAIITTLNEENSNLNLKTKMQDDEIEILKKQGLVSQNAEINAVKKD